MSKSDSSAVIETFTTESPAIYTTSITGSIPNIPACYLVFTEDADIPVHLQYQIARRIHAKTVEIRGGHLAMLSQSEAVSSAIEIFVNGVT